MKLEAKNRLAVLAADSNVESVAEKTGSDLSKIRQKLDKVHKSLDDDHPKKELLRREIARLSDVIDGMYRLAK